MIALLILACAWPISAPSPSQPYIVEVSLGDTAMAPETRAPRPEAATAGVASPEPRPGEPEAEADPGVGGDDD